MDKIFTANAGKSVMINGLTKLINERGFMPVDIPAVLIKQDQELDLSTFEYPTVESLVLAIGKVLNNSTYKKVMASLDMEEEVLFVLFTKHDDDGLPEFLTSVIRGTA